MLKKKTNAGRKCSICTHEKAKEINARIARGDSFRGISLSFGMADMSVARHTENCLQLDLKALVEEKRIDRAIDVHEEFNRQLSFARDMRIAAQEYLRHPETGEICLFPRSDEISVVYEDYLDLSNKGEPKKKTDTLDILLERIKTGSVEPTRTIIKHVDIRSFSLDAIRTADVCIDKFAKIQGLYQKDRQNEYDFQTSVELAKYFIEDGLTVEQVLSLFKRFPVLKDIDEAKLLKHLELPSYGLVG